MTVIFPSQSGKFDDFTDYRRRNFEKMNLAPEMSFKYGLNISLNFDIDLTVSLHGKARTVVRGEGAEVSFGEAPAEFFRNEKTDDKLILFNNSCFNDVMFVKIPSGTEIGGEIVVDRFYEGNVISKVCILAERDSVSKIRFVLHSDTGKYCAEDFTLIGKENSLVEISFVQNSFSENLHQRRNFLLDERARVEAKEYFGGSSHIIWRGTHELIGRGARALNTVAFLGLSGKVYDLYGESLHLAPESVSEIHTKGVLAEKSISLTRSLIKISENAPFSDGYEKHDALLLGKQIEANAIPNLEIHNHNVKCSHGTSSGKISAESLFYLMSRGISERKAKQEFVKGFFGISEGHELFEKKILEVVQ